MRLAILIGRALAADRERRAQIMLVDFMVNDFTR